MKILHKESLYAAIAQWKSERLLSSRLWVRVPLAAPMNDDKEIPKCKCGKPGLADHTCPFDEEMNPDSIHVCNCCIACMQECAWDV